MTFLSKLEPADMPEHLEGKIREVNLLSIVLEEM
jgi:hypothetical protein